MGQRGDQAATALFGLLLPLLLGSWWGFGQAQNISCAVPCGQLNPFTNDTVSRNYYCTLSSNSISCPWCILGCTLTQRLDVVAYSLCLPPVLPSVRCDNAHLAINKFCDAVVPISTENNRTNPQCYLENVGACAELCGMVAGNTLPLATTALNTTASPIFTNVLSPSDIIFFTSQAPAGTWASLLDNNSATVFSHSQLNGSGVFIMPRVGPTFISRIAITTSSNCPACDPASILIEAPLTGNRNNFSVVAAFALPSFPARSTRYEIAFPFSNTVGYSVYRVRFPSVVNPSTATALQIAGLELMSATCSTGSITSAATTNCSSRVILGTTCNVQCTNDHSHVCRQGPPVQFRSHNVPRYSHPHHGRGGQCAEHTQRFSVSRLI
eukprot:m.198004 g.198004  ORF g.198004 m.198004 type:complete len:382 (-) comp15481_c0_seq16:431-1576(-)